MPSTSSLRPAHQPADSQNFTAADGQAHALDLVVGPDDVFCLKDDLADVRLQLWIHIRDLPSHHHFNELAFVQLRCGACPDVLSIPVDADPVADGKDLRHTMGDVDDGNALLLQAADMSKQQLHFPVGDGGSGLIHDDNLGVDGDRLDDLDELALGNCQVPQRLLGRDVQSALLNQLLSLFNLGLFVHQTVLAQFPSYEDVFVYGHIQDGIELLVDHGHAHVHGFLGVGNHIGLAIKQDLTTGIPGVNPHQDFHQGRFTGSVFSHQRMDLSRPYLQLDMVQRLDAWEGFADILHFQDILHAVLPPHIYLFVIILSNTRHFWNACFSHDRGGFLAFFQKRHFV